MQDFTMQHLRGRWMKALNGIVIALSLALPGAAQARSLESLVNVQGVRKTNLSATVWWSVWTEPGIKTRSNSPTRLLPTCCASSAYSCRAKIDPKVKNVAAVAVSAMLPPMYSRGQTIDVTVSSIGDAKACAAVHYCSPNYGADGEVYALAQGSVVVGGMNATGASGSSVTEYPHRRA
jgi:flagellar P-ring protein precursor FlgI